MTTYVNDTFTGTDGTLLKAHTGELGATWTEGIGFPTTNQPQIDAYGRIRHKSGPASGVFFASGVATSDGEYVEAVVWTHTTAIGFGILARGHVNLAGSARGYMGYYSSTVGVWKILRLDNSATFTQVGGTGTKALSAAAGHTVRVTVTGTGASVSIELIVDGTTVLTVSDTSGSRITTFGSPGVYFEGAIGAFAGTQIDTLIADSATASGTINIDNPVGGKIHQRSGTTGMISVSGTYTGTPTTIEARLVLDGTNTPVSGFDWSVKDAAPSGSAYSFSFASVPQGGWYNVQVRHSNDTAVNSTSGKVGVGALFVVDGQSNAWLWFSPTAFAGDSALTPNSLLRIAGKQPTAWDVPATATMNAAIACGNAMASALSIPVGLIDGTWDGSGLTVSGNSGQWISGGAAGNAYTSSAAAVAAETTAIEGNVWIQGEADAGSSVTQSDYYTALGQMIALRRTDVGNASLPYVVATLARDTSGTSTDAKRQNINLALAQKCGDANIYRVERYDLPLHSDGIHHTASGFTTLGNRVARALLKAIGSVSTYRGPRIASVSKVNSTTFDVNLTHDNGSDFTPASAITGWRVTDGGTPVTVSTAVRQSASKVRLVLASAPTALPVVQYDYGMAPDISGVLKDNSALTLPLEFNGGVTAVEKTASVNLVNASNAAQASLTGLKWAWFDGVTPDAFSAPTDQGTGESTDGSGVLTVTIGNSAKEAGQVGWLIVTDSDGTTAMTHKAFSGPVEVS